MINNSGVVINKIDNGLLATIQATLTDDVLNQFQQDLLERLSLTKVKHVVCDLSGMEIIDIDEYVNLTLTFDMAGLMGASTVVVGLSPGIAATIVDYDVDISKYRYALNIEQGLNLIKEVQV